MSSSVVIADDNLAVRSLLVRLIRRADPSADVIAVDGGRAAIESCAAQRPAIVMLDHGLPDLNGFQVLKQLKAQGDAPYVIIVTGDPGLEQEALARGADEVWIKPMDVSLMLQQLTHLLAVH